MHYWTLAYGAIPAELQPIVDHNVKQWGMEIVRLPAIDETGEIALAEAHAIASDQYRWWRAARATEPEVYLDLDCKLLHSMADMEPNALPYWPLGNPAATPQPDTFVMLVTPEFAQAVIDATPDTMQYCWPRKTLRDWPEITMIPPEWYEHSMYSCSRRLERRKELRNERNSHREAQDSR